MDCEGFRLDHRAASFNPSGIALLSRIKMGCYCPCRRTASMMVSSPRKLLLTFRKISRPFRPSKATCSCSTPTPAP
ncbi:hypothetical protein IscW_ISCW011081 [Ixodes scapularis]|uniref:Uncharacterized protein n=1 Tax=Ixodes scapularis TaxID=6945 RepID=B7Q422_IXOSC|nr:hypothetical protein IscW_ISCW011081 [Ixodes scapularis]|eukprot:XP_002411452.1 hypothetical protein IscW_ISCW011081 [Ixodes scapularis]